MENKEAKFRDILALPFIMIAYIFIIIGLSIGGKFTAIQILKISKKIMSVEKK
jgi:hypothetical protein